MICSSLSTHPVFDEKSVKLSDKNLSKKLTQIPFPSCDLPFANSTTFTPNLPPSIQPRTAFYLRAQMNADLSKYSFVEIIFDISFFFRWGNLAEQSIHSTCRNI